MKKIMNRPAIDCVALKRQAQEKIYADTKSLSSADQIAYFRKRAEAGKLGTWWKQVSSSLTSAPLAVHEKPAKYGRKKKEV